MISNQRERVDLPMTIWRDIVGLREADDVVGDAPAHAGNGDRFGAQRFRQPERIGKPIALLVRQLQAAPRLDRDRGPGRMHRSAMRLV